MSSSARVPAFLPSSNGFRFQNHWPSEPAITLHLPTGPIGIGDASGGLCGGMTYAVRDYFEAGIPIPADAANPALDTPLYKYIVQRLVQSFDIPAGVAAYMAWQLPTRNQFKDTVSGEWPKIKAGIDAGRLVTLGLIRTRSFWPSHLGKNHQVLAHGYDLDDAGIVTIHLYDPNHAGVDTAQLTFDPHNAHGHDIGYAVAGRTVPSSAEEFTFGCFVTDYTHVAPTVVAPVKATI